MEPRKMVALTLLALIISISGTTHGAGGLGQFDPSDIDDPANPIGVWRAFSAMDTSGVADSMVYYVPDAAPLVRYVRPVVTNSGSAWASYYEIQAFQYNNLW